MKRGDQRMRREAVEALVALGEPAVLPLIAALTENVKARRKTAEAWRGRVNARYFHRLVPVLKAETNAADAGSRAAEALGSIGDARAVRVLVDVLSEDTENRWQWAETLARLSDPRTMLLLLKALAEGFREMRGAAAGALGALALRDPVPELRTALPHLRRLSRARSPEAALCAEALRQIEGATAAMKDLPLPAQSSPPPTDNLPLPASPTLDAEPPTDE